MKHRKLIVVLVALLIGLLSPYARALGSDPSKLGQEEVQQPVPPVAVETEGATKSATEKEDPQKNISSGPTSRLNEKYGDIARQPQDCTNAESNKLTDPITIFTFLAMVFTGLTWRTYHGILNTTKAIERAYVKMSHKPGFKIDLDYFSIRMEVRNFGNTPARITHCLLTHVVLPIDKPLPKLPPYGSAVRRSVEAYLVRKDSFDFQEVSKEERVPDSQGLLWFDEDGAGQKFTDPDSIHILYILGYVDYIDKFGAKYRSGYARRYNSVTKKLEFVSQPGYNYDEEQKESWCFWGLQYAPSCR